MRNKTVILNMNRMLVIFFFVAAMLNILSATVFGLEDDDVIEEIFFYDDHGKRDPFLKLVSESGVIVNYNDDFLLKDLELEGVTLSSSGNNNLAIINGKVVKVKDMVGKFEVLEIDAEFVILKKDNETFTLHLKKEE
ncbi:MAG: hypothetical protein P9X22_08995 [Candidatus Zapsychrus exili]|nr:hypothetical protein [Candidatus Zapsychrus exili]